MKYILMVLGFTISLFVSNAYADKSICTIVSGSDPLSNFELVRTKGAVFINGASMRDLDPRAEDGIYYSPKFHDYNFTVVQYSQGISIYALKRDHTRIIYHCDQTER